MCDSSQGLAIHLVTTDQTRKMSEHFLAQLFCF